MKNKKLVAVLISMLVILGVLITGFLYKQLKGSESIEKIVKDSLTSLKYSTDITYTYKNSRGDFTEKGTLEYSKENGAKINIGYVEQIFMDDKIEIHYFEDKEKGIEDKKYTVDKSYDEFYKYFMLNEINNYLSKDSTVYNRDESNADIILVEFFTESKNINFNKALLKIDSKNKIVKSLTIYDNKNKERVEVTYSNFKKIK